MANTKKSTTQSTQNSGGQGAQDTMLYQLFLDGIKDVYYAEKHITKTLPKMIKAATSAELKGAFEEHLVITKEQTARLEQVFALLETKPQAKKCEAIEGITKEGESIIADTEQGTATRDVGLILAAQKVEHYEIASYGGLAQLATTLGLSEVAELLIQTLEEEKEADTMLTAIAENDINYTAADEDADEEDSEM